MKKSSLVHLITENYKKLREAAEKDDKKAKAKTKSKKVPSYRTAKEIMAGIHEEAEIEHMDAKRSKIEQEIENIKAEIQAKYAQPVSGNVDSIVQDVKYLTKQMEELEKELASMEGRKAGEKASVATTDTPVDNTQETNETFTNPVNVINSLDRDHTPADLVNALKYAESHRNEFGDKIDAIKSKIDQNKPKDETVAELTESEVRRILQFRAGIKK